MCVRVCVCVYIHIGEARLVWGTSVGGPSCGLCAKGRVENKNISRLLSVSFSLSLLPSPSPGVATIVIDHNSRCMPTLHFPQTAAVSVDDQSPTESLFSLSFVSVSLHWRSDAVDPVDAESRDVERARGRRKRSDDDRSEKAHCSQGRGAERERERVEVNCRRRKKERGVERIEAGCKRRTERAAQCVCTCVCVCVCVDRMKGREKE